MGPFGVVGEGGTLTKPQRELYIGNLPIGVTVPQLTEFLNAGDYPSGQLVILIHPHPYYDPHTLSSLTHSLTPPPPLSMRCYIILHCTTLALRQLGAAKDGIPSLPHPLIHALSLSHTLTRTLTFLPILLHCTTLHYTTLYHHSSASVGGCEGWNTLCGLVLAVRYHIIIDIIIVNIVVVIIILVYILKNPFMSTLLHHLSLPNIAHLPSLLLHQPYYII